MDQYPWYGIVGSDEPLEQGDFLLGCPIFVPTGLGEPGEGEPAGRLLGTNLAAEVLEYDVVIMSQSCDLVQNKLQIVLVCPVSPLTEIQAKVDYIKSKKGSESLRQGSQPNYHLLNKCDMLGFEREFQVVDFRSVFGIHVDALKLIVKRQGVRLRLLPPYREHLSQAFARFFMRVGLPVDIPPFT